MEDGKPPEERLLARLEQIVAPLRSSRAESAGARRRRAGRRGRRCASESRSSRAAGGIAAVRAAASSTASGRLSKRAQRASTAARLSAEANVAPAASARDVEERDRVGRHERLHGVDVLAPTRERPPGRRQQRARPDRTRATAARHRPRRRAGARSCRAGAAAASSRPSGESRRAATLPARSSAASACATAEATRSGSRSDASGTQKTPSGNPSASSAASWSASRVLPVPPGPTSVRSRTPGSAALATSSSQLLLPPQELRRGTGRFVRKSVFSGPNSASPSWYSRTGAGEILQPVVAQIARARRTLGSSSATVEGERTTCPPCPHAPNRAARCTSSPT